MNLSLAVCFFQQDDVFVNLNQNHPLMLCLQMFVIVIIPFLRHEENTLMTPAYQSAQSCAYILPQSGLLQFQRRIRYDYCCEKYKLQSTVTSRTAIIVFPVSRINTGTCVRRDNTERIILYYTVKMPIDIGRNKKQLVF